MQFVCSTPPRKGCNNSFVQVIDALINNYFEFKFDLRKISGFLAINRDFPTQFHSERAHQNTLAMGVRDGKRIIFASRKQGQNCRAVQDSRGGVSVKLGPRQNTCTYCETVLSVGHIKCRHLFYSS
jgi:hypothetical protein